MASRRCDGLMAGLAPMGEFFSVMGTHQNRPHMLQPTAAAGPDHLMPMRSKWNPRWRKRHQRRPITRPISGVP